MSCDKRGQLGLSNIELAHVRGSIMS
ncbi:hypothetical protein CCACVL1_15214 [Corchorus capsularis]|uniref:Uncharacterized protein n=1 Tax=Corchorus capsularis TaxID=210143 RepID=A0A1R3I3H7_COCAP|nr:hypothetical protein CCACVL1_15214 [Corchorus capsularis]